MRRNLQRSPVGWHDRRRLPWASLLSWQPSCSSRGINDPGPGGHDPCYDFRSPDYPALSDDGFYHCGENGTRLLACQDHQDRLRMAGLEPTETCPTGTSP